MAGGYVDGVLSSQVCKMEFENKAMKKPLLKFISFVLLAGVLFNISCKKEYSCENCGANPPSSANKPPKAVAGPDQVITLPIDSVLLDGRQSSDPDGIISSYLWTKISGSASFIINNAHTERTILKDLAAGIYRFELKVTDNGGLSSKDTMQVMVDSVVTANHPPIANAGADQIIILPTNTVTLNGSGSADPDNNITGYTWTKISGPSFLSIANTNAVQSQVTNLVQGIYQFELKVTDVGGLFSKDTMQVIVNPASSTNLPPVARAGTDISANYDCGLNSATIILNGTASTDPDGTIVSYLWTGPVAIVNPNSATTQVSNLSLGTYEYILKVTDNNGATGLDTVLINVVAAMSRPLVPAQLVPIATLSETRPHITISAAGNKILFAGGQGIQGPCASTRVDIYDISTTTWTTAELSEGRYAMGAATTGNKIFFAGGILPQRDPNNICFFNSSPATRSSVIDIYDVATNAWSTEHLSAPRIPQGAAAGNKVIFAGGDIWYLSGIPSNVKDMYDGASGSWTAGSLSEVKGLPQIATAGSKIFLAGGARQMCDDFCAGISKRIDIYDALSNSWSVEYLSRERASMGSISANNKIYWGGGFVIGANPNNGYIATNLVEIRDLATNITSFDCLSQAKGEYTAVRKDNKIIFFPPFDGTDFNNPTKFDIYDLPTNTWSIGILPVNIFAASIISVNNIIYLAGGLVNGVLSNQVWKLAF